MSTRLRFGIVTDQNQPWPEVVERWQRFEQLGFDSGYHRTYISFLERGLKSPSLSTIMDLADTLKLPASELLKRVERVLARE